MRVLSIQSHTVHGYVGQKASTFPLQLLGIDVDPLNSVQFSNHMGYPHGAKGQVLEGQQLLEIVEGLDNNHILSQYSHLLTGYIGSVSFLRSVLTVVKLLKKRNPQLIYFLDPVLGDHGKLYVRPELVPVYRNEVLPFATVITPNQFEMELLSEREIVSEDVAWEACEWAHNVGVEIIIITSCQFANENVMCLLASTQTGERYVVDVPIIPGKYSGTGDLMAALLLAWTSKCVGDFAKALELSCASVQAVILNTQHQPVGEAAEPRELRLIQSAQEILHPTAKFQVQVRRAKIGDGKRVHLMPT